MRHFNINVNTSICQALQGVSGRVQMTHVRHVSLRRTTGVAWVELEAMLELFPNVEFLSGGAFIDAVSAAHLIERISDHRRRRITKFERLILHPELRPYLFVETPRVFPNLRELGTLAIWGGDEMWMDDVAFDWRGAGPLHSIQTFSILVFAADLLAAPSTDRFVILAGSIFELMPGITTLKITIDMVMPTRGYDEVPGSDVAVVLQFLEDLLRVGKRQSQTLRARLELLSPGHGMKKLFELPGSVHEVKRTFGRDFQTLARNAGVSLCTEERYVFDDTRD
ncbi:hypothetical protein M427DRAFT_60242 [Gonapodya prolifera JEL478]|uniref:Uncharacterized protein n=1 Tax=Gonapodya prolifera (strain JEL478) TaxID=1344416 RepID=A0A139A574_GONPJ|nr:hypothetical protein M427DRAFT_60242 [Gonapodya prolifera JEL478]|eukprot:KXS11788.1 hypothetical protein M427DRAFT_60242 [Gonapodya prolifera JEL478]